MEESIGQAGTFSRISSRCLGQIIEQAPVGIAILRGPELIYEYVNPHYQAFAPGYPLLGRRFGDANWEMPEVLTGLRQVWTTGTPWRATNLTLQIEREPAGVLEEAQFSFTCVRMGSDASPDGLVGIVLETTAQMEAQRRAVQRAAELMTIIDTMVEGVVVFDRDRHVTLSNEAARRLLSLAGATPSTLEDEREVARWLDGQPPDGAPLDPTRLPVARALAGEPSRSTLRFPNRATQRPSYVSIGATPIKDQSGAVVGAVSVASDITELTELDRLKDEFIRVIAHELKTPITVLKGYAAVLRRSLGPQLSRDQSGMLEAIGRNADRLARLLSELLDAQQIELNRLEIVKERFDLAELIADAASRIAAHSPKHHIHFARSQPVALLADAERIREVMRILLDNAVRYSPAGGDVAVEIVETARGVQVSIRDQGVGIPRDRREHIFERFYRAHSGTAHDYGGTGLGLYVARTIIERHGGSIWFTSEEERGSTFSFQLPLDAPNAK